MVQHLLAVVGNIASGKSTLVRGLSSGLHAIAEPERWSENPFLLPAQRDPERYALAAESWFVVEAAAAQARLEAVDGGILERPLQEHLAIFVADRARLGQLSPQDVAVLGHLGEGLQRTLRAIDLIVFLHAPPQELLRRIQRRGRSFELPLTAEALAQLDARYADFVATTTIPVLDVDTHAIDIRTDAGLQEVLTHVQSRVR
jgi:deoxyadenosine/deoxycytidine kinase